ncbi:hypothetical protein B4O97_04980 [Marispirochaeta aestuarii]|uniref:Thioredoxin domain-containing protein n=1 Tax=Marispirochaeta aestuarii TaxID=1963862 RepID=A0A1Y1S0U6_9SPIO|nr:cytochrome c biogenesis protein DipZ [Marispirochaeta aestuarii]ORC36981.1 hypothetical protein B4O97_04980 [Marispirochaeta aestuarii]
MMVLAFFAFLSGIVTILSPCILPVLPIVLSGSIGGKSRPLGVVAGFVISFSLFTLLLSSLVQALKVPPDALRIVAVIVILSFGAVLVVPQLQQRFERLVSRAGSRKQGRQHSGFGGGLMVGGSLGLLWTPCVGPIMASVISLAVSQQVDGGSVVIVLAYSAGTAVPMFGVMLGGRRLLNRVPKLVANTGRIQRIFGIVMIVAGISIAMGADRRFQTMVLDVFPDYGSGLTFFEDAAFIRRELDSRSGNRNGNTETEGASKPLSLENRPEKGILENFGNAPEIVTQGEWFNSRPLKMEDLRGKVVLVDFWTYSCVNCVRTMPYLRAWYEAYADQGFEIIGVHSPEFAFERDPENVARAMKDLSIRWPVVLDNDFRQWRAYNNRYWPAHFFIDAEGVIRYFHFGEGEYENSEKVIRSLLAEAGKTPEKTAEASAWEGLHSRTAETYLGYRRAEGFLSEALLKRNEPMGYSIDRVPENGEWALEGEWLIRADSIQISGQGAIELGFYSKEIYVVIEPLTRGGRVRVSVDADEKTVIEPAESGLYRLAGFDEAEERLLRLEADGDFRFYAFTFG